MDLWSLFTPSLPCLLLESYVLTGCKSNPRSSSSDKAHPGNSPTLQKSTLKRIITQDVDCVFAHLSQAHASITHDFQLQEMEDPHILKPNSETQPERAPILNEFQMKRLYSSSECLLQSFLFNFCSLLWILQLSFQLISTQTCLFCQKTPEMFNTTVCRKKRLRKEELIKMFEDFKTSAISTGLHQFNQTVKESCVRFRSHTYINTLFKL